jgi:hypothetical protein
MSSQRYSCGQDPIVVIPPRPHAKQRNVGMPLSRQNLPDSSHSGSSRSRSSDSQTGYYFASSREGSREPSSEQEAEQQASQPGPSTGPNEAAEQSSPAAAQHPMWNNVTQSVESPSQSQVAQPAPPRHNGHAPLRRIGAETFVAHLAGQEERQRAPPPQHAPGSSARQASPASSPVEHFSSPPQSPIRQVRAPAPPARLSRSIVPPPSEEARRRVALTTPVFDPNLDDDLLRAQVDAARLVTMNRQEARRQRQEAELMQAELRELAAEAAGAGDEDEDEDELAALQREAAEAELAASAPGMSRSARASRAEPPSSFPPPSAPLPRQPPRTSTPARPASRLASSESPPSIPPTLSAPAPLQPEEIEADPFAAASVSRICALVTESPYIPPFLKGEVSRFVLRQGAVLRAAAAGLSSESQEDESETQEDGFVRTKAEWFLELQRGSEEAPYFILALFIEEGTYGVQLLDEERVKAVYADPSYDPWLDRNGRPFVIRGLPGPVACASMSSFTNSDESAALRAERDTLAAQLEREQSAVAALKTQLDKASSGRAEAEKQEKFVRELLDNASEAAKRSTAEAREAEKRVKELQEQNAQLRSTLNEGLQNFHTATAAQRQQVEARCKKLEAQVAMLTELARFTDGPVRERAALWEVHVERERQKQEEVARKQAIMRAEREEHRKRLMLLGQQARAPVAEQASAVRPLSAERHVVSPPLSPVLPLDDDSESEDELAALAAEAAQAEAAEKAAEPAREPTASPTQSQQRHAARLEEIEAEAEVEEQVAPAAPPIQIEPMQEDNPPREASTHFLPTTQAPPQSSATSSYSIDMPTQSGRPLFRTTPSPPRAFRGESRFASEAREILTQELAASAVEVARAAASARASHAHLPADVAPGANAAVREAQEEMEYALSGAARATPPGAVSLDSAAAANGQLGGAQDARASSAEEGELSDTGMEDDEARMARMLLAASPIEEDVSRAGRDGGDVSVAARARLRV